LGEEHIDLVDYFNDCRRKRNLADYIGVGYVSKTEADELLSEAESFARFVQDWVYASHPHLFE
jgi:uncharacterized protein (UPF0332 family)